MFIFHCMINLLRQMKRFFVQLMNQLPYFMTQFVDKMMGWKKVMNPFSLFLQSVFSLEKIVFDLLVFCFFLITWWFSVDTISETASWVTLICWIVCWDCFIYWWYSYSYLIMIVNQQNIRTFSEEICSLSSLYITFTRI